MIYRLEHQEIYKGYHLIVIFIDYARCGYIGIPNDHILNGKGYEEIDNVNIYPHGGWTYASDAINFPCALNEFTWYFGFDCKHLGDKGDVVSQNKYGDKSHHIFEGDINGIVRTKQYVIDELQRMVDEWLQYIWCDQS